MSDIRSFCQVLSWLERAQLLTAKEEASRSNLLLSSNQVFRLLQNKEIQEDAIRLTTQFNAAGLIMYRAGHLDKARALMLLSARVCALRVDQGKEEWLDCSVQPLINLARLRGASGDMLGALNDLENLYDAVRHGGFPDLLARVSGISVKKRPYGCGSSSLSVVTNVYIADSVRSCLCTESWDELNAFIHKSSRKVQHTQGSEQYVNEAAVIIHRRMQREHLAVKLLSQMWAMTKNTPVPDPAILIHLVWSYVSLGEKTAALGTLKHLAVYAGQLVSIGAHTVAKRLYYHIALLFTSLNMFELALENAREAYRLSRLTEDEVLEHRTRLLCSLASEEPCVAGNSGVPNTEYVVEKALYLISQRRLDAPLPLLDHLPTSAQWTGVRSIDVRVTATLAQISLDQTIHPVFAMMNEALHDTAASISI